jgi:hypothetical protein
MPVDTLTKENAVLFLWGTLQINATKQGKT